MIEALASNPEVWAKTVFILNYDENDGFFDHVPPPIPPLGPALGKSTVDMAHEEGLSRRAGGPGAAACRCWSSRLWSKGGLHVQFPTARPHLGNPLPRGALRGDGAADHALAARSDRRPDVDVRLQDAEPCPRRPARRLAGLRRSGRRRRRAPCPSRRFPDIATGPASPRTGPAPGARRCPTTSTWPAIRRWKASPSRSPTPVRPARPSICASGGAASRGSYAIVDMGRQTLIDDIVPLDSGPPRPDAVQPERPAAQPSRPDAIRPPTGRAPASFLLRRRRAS